MGKSKSKSKGLKRYEPPTDEFYIEVVNPIGIDQGISNPEFHKCLGIWLECVSGIKPFAFWYFGTMTSVIAAFVDQEFTDELKRKLLGEHVIGEHLSAVFEYNYRNFGDPERVLHCKKGSYDVVPRQVYNVPLPTNYSSSLRYDRRFAIVPTEPLYPDQLADESVPIASSSEASTPLLPPPWMSVATSATLRPLGRPMPISTSGKNASSSTSVKDEPVDEKLSGRSSLGKRKRADGVKEESTDSPPPPELPPPKKRAPRNLDAYLAKLVAKKQGGSAPPLPAQSDTVKEEEDSKVKAEDSLGTPPPQSRRPPVRGDDSKKPKGPPPMRGRPPMRR
ncbi:hypothetical protein CYLTODRAFT_417241 [Cylindrobasidium torrendii FP15055 ss-10]|uniref:Uncharacterized protein n=1 Tax=Cylindrobasidium torrendii FP15055 ss-10 TaxID=1314674 RepID=A0A0D7BSQ8_9AGAR|nr:hypothetical protein CYLTODRAFT_417241 [Cylindrobasidium torrendii FP15055 ss-10]